MKSIKNILPDRSTNIKAPPSELDKLRSFLDNHPVFCFQFLHKGFTLEECSKDEKVSFITRICKLSTLKWSELQTTDRNGFGTEKIKYSSIKVGKPNFITKESEFISFKFGDIRRIIGWKNDFVFHVIYIDPKGKVYKH